MFKEWLLLQEGAMEAAIAQNNQTFSALLGIQRNWFKIIMGQAAKFVHGQDVLSLATTAANHLIMSLNNPGDKLAQAVAQVRREDPSEDSLVKLFTKAAYLRVRRFSTEYVGGKWRAMTIPAGSMESPGQHGSVFDRMADTHQGDDTDAVENLKQKVMDELRAMARENPRNTRLQLALMVAPHRLENVPEMTGLEELMRRFPQIKKTTMFKIINDIKDAFYRVASNSGDEGLQAAIEKRRA